LQMNGRTNGEGLSLRRVGNRDDNRPAEDTSRSTRYSTAIDDG